MRGLFLYKKSEQPTPTLDVLCFTANSSSSTIQLTQTGTPTSVSLEISTDGKIWNDYTIGDTITLSNAKDKVYMRNKSETATGFSTGGSNYYKFVMSGSISASGDTNYLLCKNSTDTLVGNYCFRSLFDGCTGLLTAPELPATTITNYCYQGTFNGCTSLTTPPPELPGEIKPYSYQNMFHGCTSMKYPPKLAGGGANYTYANMFYGCTKLEVLPEIQGSGSGTRCFYQMFYGCSKIKLSSTQTGDYQNPYTMPNVTGTQPFYYMFSQTGGTLTGTTSRNVTYYTSNTVIPAVS